jgi:CheY-like chemotaxis protein
VATVLARDLWMVKVDPGQVEQVLLNLVVNARDAMPEGGKLTIETANVELDQGYTRTHVEVNPGPYVMLAVSDSGCGMDAATQARIFEPFFTTKEKDKGTGLGLATVYGIVKQSGGSIWVYSEPGKGTTFKVYLPRSVEEREEVAVAASRPATARGEETVLLVEDEPSLRPLISEVLRMNGYDVLEAGNGTDALKIAFEHGGSIDLVVSDLVMPGMGGAELIRRLARSQPEMKALFISGYTEGAALHQGVRTVGVAYLQKPFTPSALAEKVREVLEAKSVREAVGSSSM